MLPPTRYEGFSPGDRRFSHNDDSRRVLTDAQDDFANELAEAKTVEKKKHNIPRRYTDRDEKCTASSVGHFDMFMFNLVSREAIEAALHVPWRYRYMHDYGGRYREDASTAGKGSGTWQGN